MNVWKTHEKTTSTSPSKKKQQRGETHFRNNRKDKRKNRLSESTVFISQNGGRSGRKEEKTEKSRRRDPIVNNGTKSSFLKLRQTAKSRSYCKLPIRMRFGCEPYWHQNRPIFLVVKIRPRPGPAECELTLPFNYPRTLNPEGSREQASTSHIKYRKSNTICATM